MPIARDSCQKFMPTPSSMPIHIDDSDDDDSSYSGQVLGVIILVLLALGVAIPIYISTRSVAPTSDRGHRIQVRFSKLISNRQWTRSKRNCASDQPDISSPPPNNDTSIVNKSSSTEFASTSSQPVDLV